MTKRKLIGVRLSEVELEHLSEASDFLGLNRSNTIRSIIRLFIRKEMKYAYEHHRTR